MKVRKNIYVIFRFINVFDLLRQKQPARKKNEKRFFLFLPDVACPSNLIPD